MQIAPTLPAPRLALAQVVLRDGQTERALGVLKPLIDANPPVLDALLTAAYAHLQAGDLARAVAEYETLPEAAKAAGAAFADRMAAGASNP